MSRQKMMTECIQMKLVKMENSEWNIYIYIYVKKAKLANGLDV